MVSMGGIILGKSTSDESEKLRLAIYALSEVATKKIKSGIIPVSYTHLTLPTTR